METSNSKGRSYLDFVKDHTVQKPFYSLTVKNISTSSIITKRLSYQSPYLLILLVIVAGNDCVNF